MVTSEFLTDCPPANCPGSLLPVTFGLEVVGWESFSDADDNSSKLIRSSENLKEKRCRRRDEEKNNIPEGISFMWNVSCMIKVTSNGDPMGFHFI